MKRVILYAIAALFMINSSCNTQLQDEEPIPPTDTIIPISVKPVVNVYIENSGSMDGYVKGITEFESAVYNYLSDIKISGITDSLNLYYINSAIIPYAQTADADVIEDFINKLEPNEFQRRGGNRGTSDIADVIKRILKDTNENTISILVTDGIFSPGRGRDAEEYLVNQQIGIKNSMSEHLREQPNSGVIVYQLSSKFDGIYYNKLDERLSCNGQQRPYYIWVFGQANDLANLRENVPENKFYGSGVQRMLTFAPGDQAINYAVVKSGSMSRRSSRHEIVGLEANRKGDVVFSVNANFKSLLLDDNYLLEAANYEVQDYNIMIKPNVSNDNFTHILTFRTDKTNRKNGELLVRLIMQKPDWNDINDKDGSRFVEGKTYGISYQIEGIYQAFVNTTKTQSYTEMKISINYK